MSTQVQKLNPSTEIESQVLQIFSDWTGTAAASTSPIFFSPWSASQILEELRAHESYGVMEQGSVVAVVFLRKTETVWEISQLATNPQKQRKGLMRRLLRHIQSQLPPGLELWLEVHEKNLGARALYESLGLKNVHRRDSYYRDGGAAILYTYKGGTS